MALLTALVAAALLWTGAPPAALGVVALVAVDPRLVLLAGALWAVVARRRRDAVDPDDEARLLRALAAELAAGASLRTAIVALAGQSGPISLHRAVRVAAAGLPAGLLADEMGRALPFNGRAVAAGLRVGAETGSGVAAVAEALADRAAEIGELERERRVQTAQARLSAHVVGGLPLALLGLLWATGRLSASLTDPAARAAVLVGAGLQVAGALVVAALVRRPAWS